MAQAVDEREVRAAWHVGYPTTPYDIWTRTNVGEVYPNPITPLTWSVYWRLAEVTFIKNPERLRLLPSEFLQDGKPPLLISAINGWLFYNTGLVYHILTERFGFPSWFYNASLGGPQVTERLGLPPRGFRSLRLLRGLPILLGESRRLDSVVRQFRRTAAAMRADVGRLRQESLNGLTIAALLARLDGISRRAQPPFAQIFDGGVAALNSYGLLAALAERWCNDTEGPTQGRALANDLLTGLANLLTARASVALWEVARAAGENAAARALIRGAPPGELRARLAAEPSAAAVVAALDRFFARHGHRAVDEFELAVPRWSEDPTFVQATLRTYLDAPLEMDPSRHLQRQRAHRIAVEQALKQHLSSGAVHRLLPWRWLVFRAALAQARRYLPMRENPKYHFLLYAAEMRHTALAIGDRLHAAGAIAQRDDIFYLRRAELDRCTKGGAPDFRPLVEARRRMYERFRAWTPPEVVRADEVAALEQFVPAEERPPPVVTGSTAPAGVLRGIAASGGIVTGRARVALNADEGANLEPGEILVAPFTDPGWTPLFTVAGAIVMDLGGLLSHGAIVAREYGIPAVVNTRTATSTLRTGQQITVNGATGEVTW